MKRRLEGLKLDEITSHEPGGSSLLPLPLPLPLPHQRARFANQNSAQTLVDIYTSQAAIGGGIPWRFL